MTSRALLSRTPGDFVITGTVALCLACAPVASASGAADGSARQIRQAVLPRSAMTVVVAEGDFEPRSIGSYSLRIYASANPGFPYDDYIAGAVRPRDGAVESVAFADVDGDRTPDIIVIIRSAGSGGYLSADAFQLSGSVLTLLGSVSGLAKDADPVQTLEAGLGNRAEHASPDTDGLQPKRGY